MRQDTRCAVERIEEETGDVIVTMADAEDDSEVREELARRYPDSSVTKASSPLLDVAPFSVWRVRLHNTPTPA